MIGKATRIIAPFLLMALLVAGRLVYLQHVHFTQAEAYYKEGNRKLALREYDTAMHFHTPWSPYVEKSARRLWEMGEALEKEGRPGWASMAYSSVRSSFYASRSLYTPGKEWIERCDEKIANLNVELLLREGSMGKADMPSEREKHLYVLKADRSPDALWTAMAEGSFFLWVGAVVFTALRGINGDGTIRWRWAFAGTLLFLLSFVLWALALLKA